MTTVLFLWFAFAFAVGFLAKQRGRSLFNWFVISAIASPVLGFVLLMMMKDLALADALDTVTPQPEFVKQRLAEKMAETQEIQAGKQGNFIIGIGIVVGISLIAWLFTFFR